MNETQTASAPPPPPAPPSALKPQGQVAEISSALTLESLALRLADLEAKTKKMLAHMGADLRHF